MQTTTTTAIEAAIVAAIHAIVPTYEHERSQTWQHTPSDRERGRALMAGDSMRSFDVVWTPDARGRSFLWYGNGEAYQCQVSVTASYRGVPPEMLAHMIVADAVDLLRAVSQLPDPTTPGLSHFEELGVGEYSIDDAANAVVEHRFRVHWAQDTD